MIKRSDEGNSGSEGTTDHDDERSRIEELIAGSVLGDLSSEEQAELDAVDLEPFRDLIFDLDKTAAAVELACLTSQPMDTIPTALRQRIESEANQYIAGSSVNTVSAGYSAAPTRISVRESIAWLACAVCLLICIGLVRQIPTDPVAKNVGKQDNSENQDSVSKPAERTLLEQREFLLKDTSTIQVAWADGKTPIDGEVSGDVVWNTAKQSGVMKFVGLPVNDPSVEQYQLWIIDPDRDEEPIDGGVFDVASDGEALVAIDAKLRVLNPKAFAITIEQPGGVVVSTQERLPLLAAVDG